MALSYEQAQKRLALATENTADRVLLSGATYLTEAQRIAIGAKMVERTGEILRLEAEANPQPARFPAVMPDTSISPAEARAKAAAIRNDPTFWSPDKLDPATRLPALTPEQHGAMVQELLALTARAGQE